MRTTSQSSSLATRAPAALTAGVLAFSAVVPPIALAEQDQTSDGTAVLTQGNGSDPDQGASFDPGGDAAGLPETASPPAAATAAPSAATGPADQTDPVVDSGDGSAADAEAPSQAPVTPPPPVTPPAPADPPAGPPVAPAADVTGAPVSPPAAAPVTAPASAVAVTRSVRRVKSVRRGTARRAPRVAKVVPVPQVIRTTTAATAARTVTPKPVAIPAALRAKPGDRTHRVRPGESLWTIATDLLGGDATTAAIAHKVDQLWARNRAAIGTGDPDLLLVGTNLTLG